MDLKDMNNNIIADQWEMRYAGLPENIRKRIDELNNSDASEYQLQVIKRKRGYPEKGDVFQINPKKDLFLYGIVVNNHIDCINGKDLIMVLIFNEKVNSEQIVEHEIKYDELLLPPQIVGKEYWTRGYFYTVAHYSKQIIFRDYGFYSIGKRKFVDEYGQEIGSTPQILGTYGVSTVTGIAMKINKELIIMGIL